MKNVSKRLGLVLTTGAILFFWATQAEAKFLWFGAPIPQSQLPSEVRASPPAEGVIPPTTPEPSIWGPIATVAGGGRPEGVDVPITALAATNTSALPIPHIPPELMKSSGANSLGGVAASSPQEAQEIENNAVLALSVAAALLASAAQGRFTEAEPTSDTTFAFADPSHPWSWKNETPLPEIIPLVADRELVADNAQTLPAKKPVAKEHFREIQWTELDNLSLDFTYGLQFVGYGITTKDGNIFVSWAINHAIRTSNALNNAVIDELEALSKLPPGTVRDKRMRTLTGYLKNPTLRKLNKWLALLGADLLEQAEAQKGG